MRRKLTFLFFIAFDALTKFFFVLFIILYVIMGDDVFLFNLFIFMIIFFHSERTQATHITNQMTINTELKTKMKLLKLILDKG